MKVESQKYKGLDAVVNGFLQSINMGCDPCLHDHALFSKVTSDGKGYRTRDVILALNKLKGELNAEFWFSIDMVSDHPKAKSTYRRAASLQDSRNHFDSALIKGGKAPSVGREVRVL